jgi:hypothetical protein
MPGAGDLGLSRVNDDIAETVLPLVLCAPMPAELHFDAREELGHVEGLDDVVVCTQLQTGDLVRQLPACSQHDDRRGDAVTPDLPAHIETVPPWKHHVEQDHVP